MTHCAIPGSREAPRRVESGDLIRGEYPPNLFTIYKTFTDTRTIRFHSTEQPTAIIYKNKTTASGNAPHRKNTNTILRIKPISINLPTAPE
jgi:hypothetical protein